MGASGQVRRLKVDASVRGSGFCDKVGDSLRPPRTRSSSSEGAEASPTPADRPFFYGFLTFVCINMKVKYGVYSNRKNATATQLFPSSFQ